MLIKFSYPYIFGILVCRSGKPALSSSDVCVYRIESIKCLFGKDIVAKYGPSAPMIHGALYFGIRGREHIHVLCRRTMQHRPRVRLRSRSRFWSPAGGGVIGRISGYSLATPLPARTQRALLYFNTIIARQVFTLPLQWCVDPYHLPLEPARSGHQWSTSP